VPVFEQLAQSRLDQDWSHDPPRKSEWRDVVYFISQPGSIPVRLNDVPVTPAAERSLDLNVFKSVRRIISRVFSNPLHSQSKKAGFDDRA
jgi:hypothetical protein